MIFLEDNPRLKALVFCHGFCQIWKVITDDIYTQEKRKIYSRELKYNHDFIAYVGLPKREHHCKVSSDVQAPCWLL